VALAALAASCSDSAQVASDGAPRDDGGVRDRSVGDPGTLPPVPTQVGVVYVGHALSTELRYYRIDGDAPTAAGTLELGAETQNMQIDPYNDLLYVVSAEASTVKIFRLDRPADAEDTLDDPEELATISISTIPMFAQVDPQRHRLYVVVSPAGEPPFDQFELRAYDVSDPEKPAELDDSPFTIATTESLALDAARQLLFVSDNVSGELYLYDLRGDRLTQLDKGPFDLPKAYPQEDPAGRVFQARGLAVDPYRNRLYAARPQGIISELIVVEYPDDLPEADRGYADLADHDDLTVIDDPFDVDVDSDDRPHLLDTHRAAVDLERGHVLLTGDAWVDAESGARAIYLSISKDMELGPGCEDFEDFGCWFRRHTGGQASGYLTTGGPACVDYTHRVAVSAGIRPGDREGFGFIQTFRYDEDLSMSSWIPADGDTLEAGQVPLVTLCH
jgi:hypothetical protein